MAPWSLLVLVLVLPLSSSALNHRGHKLFEIVPENDLQRAQLEALYERPPRHVKYLDFWNEPSKSVTPVYVGVSPGQVEQLELLLKRLRIPYDIVVDDIQSLIDEHARKNSASRAARTPTIYDTYLNYTEISTYLQDIAGECGQRCSIINIGKSYEGRDLRVIKISSNVASRDGVQKRLVWIDAGIHAREWITNAVALYFIDRLVSDYNYDRQVRALVDTYDWYILPCVNPDGYDYSHTTDRRWRKTRSKTKGSTCVGTDANRNYDFHWGTVGTSDDPCDEIYKGQRAFSEPESRAVANYIASRNGTWLVYLTLHSYKQLWMTPYGYTSNKPHNYDVLMDVAREGVGALSSMYGTKYGVGQASDILYPSSGTSRDWAAGVARIPFVYTLELRDRGAYGFLLPADQIEPSGVETWEGVKAMMRAVRHSEISLEPVNSLN